MRTAVKRITEGAYLTVATALLAVGIYTIFTFGMAQSPVITLVTLAALVLVGAAYLTGLAADQLKESTSTTDPVQAALGKAGFEERAAVGTIDERIVLAEAALNSHHDHPELTIRAGGTWQTHSDDEGDWTYDGGEVVREGFHDVDALLEEFDTLVEQYDLTPVEEVDA